MLDKMLEVAYRTEQTKTASRAMVDKLKELPLEELQRYLDGDPNCKLAYVDGGANQSAKEGSSSDFCWLDKYMGTPFFSKAVELEKALLQLDAEEQAQREAERAARPAPSDVWAKRDALQLQKRMLDLDFILAQNGGTPAGGSPEAKEEHAIGELQEAQAQEAVEGGGGDAAHEATEDEALALLEQAHGGGGAPPQAPPQPPKPKAPSQQAQDGEGEKEEVEEGGEKKDDKPKGMSVEVKQAFISRGEALAALLGAGAGAVQGGPEMALPGAVAGGAGALVGSGAGALAGHMLGGGTPLGRNIGGISGGVLGYRMATKGLGEEKAKRARSSEGAPSEDKTAGVWEGRSNEGVAPGTNVPVQQAGGSRQGAGASDDLPLQAAEKMAAKASVGVQVGRFLAKTAASSPEGHQLRRALLGNPISSAIEAEPGKRLDAFGEAHGHVTAERLKGGLKGGLWGAGLGGAGGLALALANKGDPARALGYGAGLGGVAGLGLGDLYGSVKGTHGAEASRIHGARSKDKEPEKVAFIGGLVNAAKSAVPALGQVATGAKNLAQTAHAAGGMPQVLSSFGNVAKNFAQKNPLTAAGIAGAGGLAAGKMLSNSQPR